VRHLHLTLLAGTLVLVAARGGRANAPPSTTTPPPATPPATEVAATSPYVAGAPYAGTLRRCTCAGSATAECSLGELPFLGMETTRPTIADVMGCARPTTIRKPAPSTSIPSSCGSAWPNATRCRTRRTAQRLRPGSVVRAAVALPAQRPAAHTSGRSSDAVVVYPGNLAAYESFLTASRRPGR